MNDHPIQKKELLANLELANQAMDCALKKALKSSTHSHLTLKGLIELLKNLDQHGNSALHIAAYTKNNVFFDLLSDKVNGEESLESRNVFLKDINRLLAKGGGNTERLHKFYNPLIYAIEDNQPILVESILKLAGDFSKEYINDFIIRGGVGNKKIYPASPLIVAIESNHAEMVRVLLEHNADGLKEEVKMGVLSPLSIIKQLRETEPNNLSYQEMETYLHDAIQKKTPTHYTQNPSIIFSSRPTVNKQKNLPECLGPETQSPNKN